MRMWMVRPDLFCRQHLLGQHQECHTFIGSIKRKISLRGYVDNNLLELDAIYWYHEQCAHELINRGYNHKSPLQVIKFEDYISDPYILESTVDKPKALLSLLLRCKECTKKYESKIGPVQDFFNTEIH